MFATALVMAGLAAVLWSGPGALQLRRLGLREAKTPPIWWGGRPGALDRPTRALVAAASGIAVVLFVESWWGPLAAVAAGVLGYVAAGQVISPAYRRQRALLVSQLPQALDFLAVTLAAGAPIGRAMEKVAAVSPPEAAGVLNGIISHIHVGATESEAWATIARDHPWGSVARDVARAAHSGAALVDILRAHAEDGRRHRKELLEANAKRVGVKVTMPLMLCFLPAFLALGVAPTVIGLLTNFFNR